MGTELISRAWYLSGIVARELETVSAAKITEGLALLNELLSLQGINGTYIPYYTLYEFNSVPSQEKYFVPGLIEPATVTFNLNQIRFSLINKGRNQWFGESRVDNINSLPYSSHFERALNGMDLYLYFLPNAIYPIKIFGKFKLSKVALNDDLETLIDDFYIAYLRYSLANKMCEEYGLSVEPNVTNQLRILQNKIANLSPKDFSLKKISTLQSNGGMNWAWVNLGTGWWPS